MTKSFLDRKKENYDRLKYKMSSLLFLDGVAIYNDPLQESVRKYSLVDQVGKFVFDKVNGFGESFVERIQIHESGLFLVPLLYGDYLIDKDANYQKVENFGLFQKILSNRTSNLGINEFYEIPSELRNTSFQICKGAGYGWTTKPGETYLEFGEKDNGLIYSVKYHRDPGKDHEYSFEYVSDKVGNKMFLNEFWNCFRMVENGKKYLQAGREYLTLIST